MWRCKPSKLSNPAAANVLALTARSSVRARRTDALTSHPRMPFATLAAERGAVRARVGATTEPVAIEADQVRVAHQIAPRVDHLNVVAPSSQLVGDAAREPTLDAQTARGLAPRAPEEPA